jgi:two-component system, OmpR family, sensor kinase
MFKSLYSKLSLVLLGLFFLVGAAFIVIGVYITGMYQQEVNQKLNRDVARYIVAEKLVFRNGSMNQNSLKEIFHMLMVVNPSLEVYFLDPQGNVLAFSAEPGKVKREKVDLKPIRRFLTQKTGLPVLGDDPREKSGKKIFAAARIPERGQLEGYLYIILGGEVYDTLIHKLQKSYVLRLGLWGSVASLVVAALAGLAIFAWLTRRLRRLAIAMSEYKEGAEVDSLGLSHYEARGDEIDLLVSTFRQMAERIEAQVKSLKEEDTMRRELVANVSHDLRTPLATLRGYVETLLIKNESLSSEERQNYLDITLRHCRRLSNLVADLFDLSKLEAKDWNLHAEPFNLGELVQDVVQKFRLQAEKKEIQVHTSMDTGILFVHADIALIERVLENLLENAIRHTPVEGSVGVVLRQEQDGVAVEVSDTGTGISEDELPKIFDRFHQPDKSQRDEAGHSGLGLAITKKILELHGSTIRVSSRQGEGTTFTFSLPVHKSR